jgi:hypothetical protein
VVAPGPGWVGQSAGVVYGCFGASEENRGGPIVCRCADAVSGFQYAVGVGDFGSGTLAAKADK